MKPQNDTDSSLPAPSCYTAQDAARLQEMQQTLNEVKSALVGNPSIGFRGVIPRLDLVETTVANIAAERAAEKSTRKGAVATITAIGAFAGSVGAVAAWLIQQLTSRH